MIHPRRNPPLSSHWAHFLAAVFCLVAALRIHAAGPHESAPGATVHPILMPTTAIEAPLAMSADHACVWHKDQDQRMFLQGHVGILIGYRELSADSAAIWLTPSSESGEGTFDAAIYLAGNVQVKEGRKVGATLTYGKELMVTTRISQNVQLHGTPVSKAEDDNPVVARGGELRTELLNHPTAPMYVPKIVITPAELALQEGWIARGPNNRIIPGPGDVQLVRNEHGDLVPASRPKVQKPIPAIYATGDDVHGQQTDKEIITIISNAYLSLDLQDKNPPIQFRAQRMVLFSPLPAQATQPAGTTSASRPATRPATPEGEVARYVTGIYLEGDVTLDQGDRLVIQAERIYYDTTSQRAIMLDATLSTVDEIRSIPLYMRAEEIRQLARGEYAAKKATFSTSEFHTPHYHIGASDIYLQDITPGEEGGADLGLGGEDLRTYAFKAKDATINIQGTPVFYWPYLSGDTSKNEIPLRTFRVSNSNTYGPSILTKWDLFALADQTPPPGATADLNLDYFGKRGPAAGVDSLWNDDDSHGLLRSYIILDQGTDDLGKDRSGLPPEQQIRDRGTIRHQQDLGDGFTLQLEASYISDPTFLEQFFNHEYDTDKAPETSFYLKKQGETDALSLLGKFSLMGFTASADQVDDQYQTEKRPELKYWRIGDSILDLFTYYSESGIADVHANITKFSPQDLGFTTPFLGAPAAAVPLNETFRDYYRSLGWATGDVVRADTRQELDLPLQVGDAKVVPYVTGRYTWWDDSFPEDPATGSGGTTSRIWGAAGLRSSLQFWRVYDDVNSVFFDVHRIRHIIEPQFNLFVSGSDQDRRNLMPFDRDVEAISTASGMQLGLEQKWQTKRGGDGHWRDVDWLTLDLHWNQFWNKDQTGTFFPMNSIRGFYFPSRPELSLAQNSIDTEAVWRAGERYRFLGEANYGLDTGRLEQFATGVAVDQTDSLAYFFGNRYVDALHSDEWTFAVDYQLTKKYELIAAESYDFQIHNNILSSLSLIRRLPRFVVAITVTYDANSSDTSVVFTAWPEGFPEAGFGKSSLEHRTTAGSTDSSSTNYMP